jgi:hypothetical protein
MNDSPGSTLRLLATVACAALVAAACVAAATNPPTSLPAASSTNEWLAPPPSPGVAETAGGVSAAPSMAAGPTATLNLAEADNGRTLTVSVGATLTLVLHNTYWTVQGSSNASVLAPLGQPVYSGAGTIKCIPGTGCGTVTATFKAVAQGSSLISASRTGCGEVLPCVDGAASFEVTVVVTP